MTKKKSRRGFILAALVTATGCYATAGAADCTRQELAASVNTYFKALTAHNAKRLPLNRHAGFTENGMPKDFGEGFWEASK